jgi:cephalosporin hydroxylase
MTEAHRNFLNFEMGQNSLAIPTLDEFLRTIPVPDQIIEIGTGKGGFSVFLQMACMRYQSQFVTYDIDASRLMYRHMFKVMGIDYRVQDVFECEQEVIDLIKQNGTTILFCDGGDKVKEFNTFAPHLKEGDFILAHDYAVDHSFFEKHIKGKYWNNCETTLSDIMDTKIKYNLENFMNEYWNKCAWCCYKKEWK